MATRPLCMACSACCRTALAAVHESIQTRPVWRGPNRRQRRPHAWYDTAALGECRLLISMCRTHTRILGIPLWHGGYRTPGTRADKTACRNRKNSRQEVIPRPWPHGMSAVVVR
ncbi:uncharacterized protein BDZ99DRAFT_458107 [Mytilinidion resinicola]|uniref:Uncharacterized protein n=1 Tax=Mytilinidion resinicola TaxID=574789 RepID=A0A6A6Z505_9PEZI|nr:uncharacterized protein BDZ99DRAFT_458107 [Mytilinidion resinicola]KAF2816211.1 hypothetical protein BDZ99DRAFT_458107 [Mytilinidion resinicola]